ncbi:MAG: MBOAT family protein [Spirochaetes bacterium]|jgi:alginate O-acetyltransferase complex protein AlgI|nr:MBOAT family protein [Spirochaetota bacterium]
MVFSSVHFLFFYFPVVLTVYFIIPKRFRNLFLMLMSILFYVWGEGVYSAIMIISVIVNYFLGLLVVKGNRWISPKKAMIVAVLVNLGLLGFFKYFNFFIDNVNQMRALFGALPVEYDKVHLPIGISFFTFHSLSYLIDVYRGEVNVQKRFTNIALYISLFPQLIAGPIIRYHDVASQLIERYITREKFALGFQRFIIGLGKKVLIANTAALTADKIFAISTMELTTPLAWIGLLCYAIQLYYDFSGYSDMAIGLAHMFGFTFLENFNYPFISLSIREHWTRWHISLTNWFRDYLYISLGGNRVSQARNYINLIIVFVLCGFWHGAEWHYLVWGLYNGMFLVLERLKIIKVEKFRFTIVKWFYATIVILIGYVFFRSDSMSFALDFIAALFGFAKGSGIGHHVFFYLQTDTILALALGAIGSGPVCPYINEIITTALDRDEKPATVFFRNIYPFIKVCLLFMILGLSILKISAGTYNPFIYFRF